MTTSKQIKQLIREVRKLEPKRNVRVLMDSQDYVGKDFYQRVNIQIGTIYDSDGIFVEGKTLEEARKNLFKELKGSKK